VLGAGDYSAVSECPILQRPIPQTIHERPDEQINDSLVCATFRGVFAPKLLYRNLQKPVFKHTPILPNEKVMEFDQTIDSLLVVWPRGHLKKVKFSNQ
jgi:hypothetical protein